MLNKNTLSILKAHMGTWRGWSLPRVCQAALDTGTLCMKIGQCRGRKGTAQNQAFFNDSVMFSSHQIKEAADIIQKLHLIAQELPFDR